MQRRLRLIFTALVMGIFILAHPPVATATDTKASIVLQWLPQAQFAGYYMAKEKGFYSDAGIDLTILSGGPDIMASEYLETGKADFATMFLGSALQRHETLPLVNIGQIVQSSALMLIARKGSGIQSIEDLDGKKVGLWANEFEIQARTLFRQKGIDVTVVPQANSLDLFMRGGVSAASGMWYNEYHTLYTYGLNEDELLSFFFSDYGLNFPEDGIYALGTTVAENPELCSNLRQATIKGWLYAFEHPEETLDIVIQRMHEAGVPANRAHQRWMLDRMKDIIRIYDTKTLGVLLQSDYERVSQILLEYGFIKKAPAYNEFYMGEVR